MNDKSPEAFRTISEVADWLGVPAHVLRFWESRFGQVKPVKRAGGRRYYRPSDMELLGGIRKLLHEDGMTIRGVQKLLRENGVRYVAAMSPPLDQPADLRDVSPDEDVQEADEATARDRATPAPVPPRPVFDSAAEDAVEVDDAEPAEEPAGIEEIGAAEPGAPGIAETVTVAAEDEGDVFGEDGVDGSDGGRGADRSAEAVVAPVFADDTEMDERPDSMDFFAHEAEPDMSEGPAPEAQDAGTAPVPDAVSPEAGPAPAAMAEETAAEVMAEQTVAGPEAGATRDTPAAGTEAGTGAGTGAGTDVLPPESALETADAEAPETATGADVGEPEAAEPDDVSAVFAGDGARAAVELPTPGPATPETATGPADTAAALSPSPSDRDEAPAERASDPQREPAAEDAAEDAARPAAFPAETAREAPTPQIADAPPDTAPVTPPTAAPPAAAAEPTPAPQPPQEAPRAAAPDLVMPDIGPDPDDDAAPRHTPALAAALRRRSPGAPGAARAMGLNLALLQAYADRLQALSGRLGATPEGRRPF